MFSIQYRDIVWFDPHIVVDGDPNKTKLIYI